MNHKFLEDYGKPPEPEEKAPLTDEARRRRWFAIGGGALALLALGFVIWFFLFGPTPLELKARKFSVPDRQFVDQNMRLDLPSGWLMLKRDNPFFHDVRSGQMFAIHPRSGCTSVVYIWPNNGAPLDFQLDYVRDRFYGWDRITERDRQTVTIAGREARRATYDLWRRNAIKEVAYVTILNDELRYYVLLGYTPIEGGEASAAAFRTLEQGLHVGPSLVAPQAPQAPTPTPAQ
ncbi:MAG TPA: hypothetical protein VF528_07910 [Pyrinomonadaceae bacterium]|jgi:hypothetical protein